MIYIFGDLRQLRSFELVRPSISSPQRLRPLRNNPPLVRPPPPEPEPWSIPIKRPPIIPRPVHDPEMSSTSPIPTNPRRLLRPDLDPYPSSPSFRFPSNTGLRADNANPRATLSVSADSFTSFDSDASRTSTASSDQVEIHISEAFQDIDPPYIEDEFVTASPVPSSWQAESPSNTPSPWIPHLMAYNIGSPIPASPASQKLFSSTDNSLRATNARTSTTLEKEEELEKWIPTASFIRPFEYNEWEEWDGESFVCTTEGSLGGYGGGDEESRISYLMHPTRFGQDRQRGVGTKVPTQLRAGSRRGTIASSKGPDQLGTFDFDALPAFQAVVPPAVAPAFQRKPRYRTCDASPPPPLNDETTLAELGRQGGILRTWFVEVPKVFIRRIQVKCGAAKEVMKDVLSRSAGEASRRNGGGNGNGGPYRDVSETGGDGRQRTTSTAPLPPSNLDHTVSKAKGKEKLQVEQVKEGWRARWKRVLSVPAFKSPLTKILSPVVTRAQWEIVVRSGLLAFVISAIVVAILVAVPVPP